MRCAGLCKTRVPVRYPGEGNVEAITALIPEQEPEYTGNIRLLRMGYLSWGENINSITYAGTFRRKRMLSGQSKPRVIQRRYGEPQHYFNASA